MSSSLVKLIFIWVVAYIFLLWINIEWFSFWMDNWWLIDTKYSVLNYMYARNIDLLWGVDFASYTSISHYLLSFVFLNLFWFNYGYYLMYFMLISIVLFIWYKISNFFIKDDIKSLFLSIIFVFNLPFLRFFYWQWTLTFIIAVIWFLLSLFFIFKLKESTKTNTNTYLILIVLSSILVTHPFLFFFYYIIIFSLLYFYSKVSFQKIIVFSIIFWLVHFFWIFQFIIWNSINYSLFLQKDYSDALVNVFSANSQLYNSFVFLWKNSDYINEFFWWIWILIIILYVFLWLIFFKLLIKIKLEKLSIILLSIILFLLLFSVWARQPLWIFYSYLYNNISFFSFFRTFSNVLLFCFYLFILFIIIHWNKKIYNYIIISNILFVWLFIFSINYSWYNKTTNIPNDYFSVKEIVDWWSVWKNVLVLPCSQYDYYKWDTWWQDKYFLESFFNKNWIIFYRPTLSNNYTLKKLFYDVCSYQISFEDLKKYNVNYILYRKDLLYSEKWYFTPYNENALNGLNKVYSWDNLSLYKLNFENIDNFTQKNPVTYKTKNNLTWSLSLYFLNNYNPNWKLYLNWTEWLFTEPLFDNTHKIVYDYANLWTISKDEIINYVQENYWKELQKWWYPKKLSDWRLDYKYYVLNSDWSIDTELTLYFKPQSYFYLWIIISSITILVILLYFIIENTKNILIRKHESK